VSGAPDPAAIVAEARAWIGTPYRHQASLKGVGCDCLGLLRGVWRAVVGVEPEGPPPYSADWAEAGADALMAAARRHLAEAPEVAPGRVLLFRWRDGLPAKHCAIATSAATMVHAMTAPPSPRWRSGPGGAGISRGCSRFGRVASGEW
jgi:NlpC/P60 family putative phage cell wall peptidase